MLSQRLVDRGAVSATQGKRRSVRGKTLPKELEQPEFLCGRQLEELVDVGVTHGA
jgi:hypothetical protein